MAEIWAELLGVERVGIHDDFIHLGGDSLIATRAVSRIRDRFGVEVSIQAVLDETIAQLTAAPPLDGC